MIQRSPLKKTCTCGHGRAAHHPAGKNPSRRLECWFPDCKCRDYVLAEKKK